MCEYALVMLNMMEYAKIYPLHLKNTVLNAIIIENVSDKVQSIKSPYNFQNRCVQKTLKTSKMDCFAKKTMPEWRCATRYFSGQGDVELGHFDKHFVKNTRKRGLAGIHFY